MSIEIREIIIRTEIQSNNKASKPIQSSELLAFKRQLLEECKRMIVQKAKDSHKR